MASVNVTTADPVSTPILEEISGKFVNEKEDIQIEVRTKYLREDQVTLTVEGLPPGAKFEIKTEEGPGIIDIFDVSVIARIFGVQDRYDPLADLNGNNEVDIFDVAVIAKMFGSQEGSGEYQEYADLSKKERKALFSWAPEYGQSGTYYVTFKATNEQGEAYSQQINITVIPTEIILPADVIASPDSDRIIYVGDTLTFDGLEHDGIKKYKWNFDSALGEEKFYGHIFVTNGEWAPGNFGGLEGADAKCQAEADAAELEGTWKAFLSANDATDKCSSNKVVRNRLTIFNNYKLTDGTNIGGLDADISAPVNKDANGNIVNGKTVTYTEVRNDFYLCAQQQDSQKGSRDCDDWTNTEAERTVTTGDTGTTTYGWAMYGPSVACSEPVHLYCVRQEEVQDDNNIINQKTTDAAFNTAGEYDIELSVYDKANKWHLPDSVKITVREYPTIFLDKPANNEPSVSVDADLSWQGNSPSGLDISFDVYFGTSPDNLQKITRDDDTLTTYDPGKLEFATDYYWRIIVNEKEGASVSSNVWKFTTEQMPVAKGIEVKTNENTPKEITLSCFDAYGGSLDYFILTPALHGSLDDIDGDGITQDAIPYKLDGEKVIYTPNTGFYGEDSFIYKCNNSRADSDAAAVIIRVNALPAWKDIPDISLDEDFESFVYIDNLLEYAADPDSDSITFSVASEDTNKVHCEITDNKLMLHSVLNWNSFLGDNGASCTIRATDSSDGTADESFSITVKPLGDPTEIESFGVSTNEDASVNIPLRCTNVDGEHLNYYVDTEDLPANGGLSGSGLVITYNPNSGFIGADSFKYYCYDGVSYTDKATVAITVNRVNNLPYATIDSPSSQTIAVGSSLSFSATDSDSDGYISERRWSFGGSGIPDSYEQDPGSRIFNNAGTFTVTYSVWDNDGATPLLPSEVIIAVGYAPDVSDIPGQAISEGGTFSTIPLDNYVSDNDNADNEITWTYSGNNELSVSINSNRVAAITAPDENWNGAETITFRATDPHGLSDSGSADSAVFAAADINDPPTIGSLPVTSAAEGVAYYYDFNASDIDGDTLTYSLTTYPPGMAIDSATGEISWTPGYDTLLQKDSPTNFDVVVSVTDSYNGAITQSFSISVADRKRDIEVNNLVEENYPVVNGETKYSVDIKNNGIPTESFDVQLKVNGNVKDSATVSNLAPGVTQNIELSHTFTASGDYDVIVSVDSLTGEEDIGDNSKSMAAYARTFSQLQDDFKFGFSLSAPDKYDKNQDFPVYVNVYNFQPKPIIVPVTLEVESPMTISDSSSQTLTLAGNSQTTPPLNWAVNSGNELGFHFVKAHIDDLTKTDQVNVTEPSSPLISLSLDYNPIMNVGSVYPVTVIVHNSGTEDARNVEVILALSEGLSTSEDLIKIVDEVNVDASANVVWQIRVDSAGTHTITATRGDYDSKGEDAQDTPENPPETPLQEPPQEPPAGPPENPSSGFHDSYSAAPTTGNAPLAVQFHASGEGGTAPYSYYWNFDDGTATFEQNPVHVFTKAAKYYVALTVQDANGNSETNSLTINAGSTERSYKTNSEQVYINKLRFNDEHVKAGNAVEISLNFENLGKKMSNVKVAADIPELGVRSSTSVNNVGYGRNTNNKIFLGIPDYAKPGNYDIRITISSDGVIKRVEYRPITIIK